MENSWDISVSVRLILYPVCAASELLIGRK
jgi:hypothetical protein